MRRLQAKLFERQIEKDAVLTNKQAAIVIIVISGYTALCGDPTSESQVAAQGLVRHRFLMHLDLRIVRWIRGRRRLSDRRSAGVLL